MLFLGIIYIPCSIGPKEGEFSWKPCIRCQKDSSLGLIIWSWQPFYTLRKRFTRRSFKEQIAFHSSSQGCYAKFWNIEDTRLSLSWREREYAVSHSLLINGIIWRPTKLISLGSLSQQQGEPPQDIHLKVLHLLLLPSLELHHLHLLHHSHPHQLSRGWPSLYPNIESCVVHWRLLQLPRAILLRNWQPSKHGPNQIIVLNWFKVFPFCRNQTNLNKKIQIFISKYKTMWIMDNHKLISHKNKNIDL